MQEVNVFANMLKHVYDTTKKPKELELAYVVRGKENIIKRMKY
jgi:hypothetical protein